MSGGLNVAEKIKGDELMPMLGVWIAVIVIAVIVEAASVQLLSVWFALGGLVALILSIFNISTTIQIIVFAAVSIISLILFLDFLAKPNLFPISSYFVSLKE